MRSGQYRSPGSRFGLRVGAVAQRSGIGPEQVVQDLEVVEPVRLDQRQRVAAEALVAEAREVEHEHVVRERVEVEAVAGVGGAAQRGGGVGPVLEPLGGGVEQLEAADGLVGGRRDRVVAEVEVGELGDVGGRDGGQRQQGDPVDLREQVWQHQPGDLLGGRGRAQAAAEAAHRHPAEAGAAPKSANNLNAKLCTQGRHVSLLRAETGLGFKNAGECVRHGAKGGAFTGLTLSNATYDCQGESGTCFGTVTGSGLQVGSNVALSLTFEDGGGTTDNFTVDSNGNCCVESGVPWMVNLVCNEGNTTTLDVVGTSAGGDTLNPPDVETPNC